MKILHLNAVEHTGGAAKAMNRLHAGLRQLGIESTIGFQRKESGSPLARLPSKIINGIKIFIEASALRPYKNRKSAIFSPAICPDSIQKLIDRVKPDLLHLHWINNGFIKIESLQKIKIPIVWTLHDLWPATGGCHLPGDCERFYQACGQCPVLNSREHFDLSHQVLNRKLTSWKNLNLALIAPSHWIKEQAQQSSLFSKIKIEVIHNALNTDVFFLRNKKEARAQLNLPSEEKLILFGALRADSDMNKGLDLLIESLRLLKKRPNILTFGSPKKVKWMNEFSVRNFGIIENERKLAMLYSAADVTVCPSRQESLSYLTMESLSCGTPVVAFDSSGPKDLIQHRNTGYLAKASQASDFALGIEWCLENTNENMSAQCSQSVSSLAPENIALKYLEIYKSAGASKVPS